MDKKRLADHLNLHKNKFGSILKILKIGSIKLNADFIGSNNNCKLGQWITRTEAVFRGNSDFEKLDNLHTRFHHLSAQILRQIECGDKKAALKLVAEGSEFSKISNDIVTYIIRIQRLVNR